MGVPLKNPTPKPQTPTLNRGSVNPTQLRQSFMDMAKSSGKATMSFMSLSVGCISGGALKRVYGLGFWGFRGLGVQGLGVQGFRV